MARYTGASFKKSRQLGFSTLGNGKELARRPYAPGAHGKDRKRKLSEYGIQLEEKQKAKRSSFENEEIKKLYKEYLKKQIKLVLIAVNYSGIYILTQAR